MRKRKNCKAGVIYSGVDDSAIYPFCQIGKFNWQQGDDPIVDHMNWNPYCEFSDMEETYSN